jgi:ferritin-like metal-binding protein YciE
MKMQTLYDLYLAELRDLYDTEHQVLKALPKMIDAATTDELKKAFRDDLDQAQMHVNRLDEVFRMHGEDPKAAQCQGIEGILKEGRELMKADATVRDAALISAAQRIEHYEIAVYGCARTYANQLGFDRAGQVLQNTLRDEEETDRKLTSLAESRVNIEAAHRARS